MQRRLIQARIVNPLLGTDAIPLPDYATGGSAALDLRACLDAPLTLAPGARLPVPTGLALNMMDPGLVAIVASRSGLSLKHDIRVAQGIGVIDKVQPAGELVARLAEEYFAAKATLCA